MSEHQIIAELAKKAEQDPVLRAALQAAQTPTEVVTAAASAGVTITADEVIAFQEQVQAASHELSEAELEQAAGGIGGGFFGFMAVAPVLAFGGAITGAGSMIKNAWDAAHGNVK